VFLDYADFICFLPLVTHLHALIWLHIPCIPIGLCLCLVDLLSPTVISCRTSLPSFMMLSLTCVFMRVFGLLPVVIWGDHGEDRWCGLSKEWNGGDGWYRHGMWLLEYAKDWILEVDTPGQHVPPCVRYGTVCWLIRNALVSCLVGWARLVWLYLQGRKVQEAPEGILLYPIWGNLSNYKRDLRVFYCTQKWETYGKVRHTI
jgi:hypothetical protein